MKKLVITAVICSFCVTTVFSQQPGQKKILFDCTHSESAGNGDWVIDADLENLDWHPGPVTGTGSSDDHANPQRYPTPAQTAVTSSTAETYWQGGLSYWAIDLVNKGFWVETLPPITGQITYGNTSNAQDLSNYTVFIVDEPNIVFSTAEKTAIMNFIANGGALFAISDHTGSDRNNDGWDSPAIWNDFLTNNSVQNNAFGYTFALQNFSDANYNSNVSIASTDSITRGPFGNVSEVKWSNGTCMTMNPTQNSSVKGHVWKSGKGQTDTAVCCVTARWGCGKIASIGDSSPPDDGTGNPAVTLYTGYTGDANGNHRPWLVNTVLWLANTGCSTTAVINPIEEQNNVEVYPNPAYNNTNIHFVNTGNTIATVNIFNMNGQIVNATQSHTKNNSEENFTIDTSNLPAGIYYCKVVFENKIITRKIIVSK